jgi:hypothetical protein
MSVQTTMLKFTRGAKRRFASFHLFSRDGGQRGPALRLLPSIAAAVIGVAITTTAAYVVSVGEQRNAKLAFDVAAENRSRVLQAGLNE